MTRLLPLIIFLIMVGFLAWGLQRDPSRIDSPLIDQAAPAFSLPVLGSDTTFTSADMLGKPWVLNVFASWCGPCIAEHPVLTDLAEQQNAPVVALNYKDRSADAVAWLARYGDPFYVVAEDQAGSVGIDWGVYGVPETFVIDAEGNVRYKHIGPLSDEDMKNTVMPLLQSLSSQELSSL